jgi:hypothetical protein
MDGIGHISLSPIDMGHRLTLLLISRFRFRSFKEVSLSKTQLPHNPKPCEERSHAAGGLPRSCKLALEATLKNSDSIHWAIWVGNFEFLISMHHTTARLRPVHHSSCANPDSPISARTLPLKLSQERHSCKDEDDCNLCKLSFLNSSIAMRATPITIILEQCRKCSCSQLCQIILIRFDERNDDMHPSIVSVV